MNAQAKPGFWNGVCSTLAALGSFYLCYTNPILGLMILGSCAIVFGGMRIIIWYQLRKAGLRVVNGTVFMNASAVKKILDNALKRQP